MPLSRSISSNAIPQDSLTLASAASRRHICTRRRIVASGLRTSWATPATSRPRLARRSAWRSCDSISFSCSIFSFSVSPSRLMAWTICCISAGSLVVSIREDRVVFERLQAHSQFFRTPPCRLRITSSVSNTLASAAAARLAVIRYARNRFAPGKSAIRLTDHALPTTEYPSRIGIALMRNSPAGFDV